MTNSLNVSHTFCFSFGHRIHNNDSKCKHLHGHDVKVQMDISIVHARQKECVFSKLQLVENTLHNLVDSKSIYDINDPFINGLLDGGDILVRDDDCPYAIQLSKHYGREQLRTEGIFCPTTSVLMGYRINVDHWEECDKKQFYGGIVLATFVPSSKNLCELLTSLVYRCLLSCDIKSITVLWTDGTGEYKSSKGFDL